MNMRVSPDMPTRRREPNPMTCVTIPGMDVAFCSPTQWVSLTWQLY